MVSRRASSGRSGGEFARSAGLGTFSRADEQSETDEADRGLDDAAEDRRARGPQLADDCRQLADREASSARPQDELDVEQAPA
jgi:O-acetyl-ADP-ribose deacetylase (regulator of RNase III)